MKNKLKLFYKAYLFILTIEIENSSVSVQVLVTKLKKELF